MKTCSTNFTKVFPEYSNIKSNNIKSFLIRKIIFSELGFYNKD